MKKASPTVYVPTHQKHREEKVTDEGIRVVREENENGGNDVTVHLSTLTLQSKSRFSQYNGKWVKSGSFYTPMNKREDKEDG